MITSPMHNMLWYGAPDVKPSRGFYRITCRWLVGGMTASQTFVVREDDPDFWGLIAKIADCMAREFLWQESPASIMRRRAECLTRM